MFNFIPESHPTLPGLVKGFAFDERAYTTSRLPIDRADLTTTTLFVQNPATPSVRPRRRVWEADETAIFTAGIAARVPYAVLAPQLGRTVSALASKAYRLGLRRRAQQTSLALRTPEPAPVLEPIDHIIPASYKVQKRPNGRSIWDAEAVHYHGAGWMHGMNHKALAERLGCTDGASRTIGFRVGMTTRAGHSLRKEYDPNAPMLIGIEDQMVEARCMATGKLFFVRKADKARSRFCPDYKKSKAYKACHAD